MRVNERHLRNTAERCAGYVGSGGGLHTQIRAACAAAGKYILHNAKLMNPLRYLNMLIRIHKVGSCVLAYQLRDFSCQSMARGTS